MKWLTQFIKDLLARFTKHDVPAYCTQMAYYFILSIFPLLIFTITIVANLNLDLDVIFGALQQSMPAEVSNMLKSIVKNTFSQKNGWIAIASALLMLYSSSRAVGAIQHAINVAYEVKNTRGFIVSKLVSVLYTFGFVLLLILSVALPDALSSIILFIEKNFSIALNPVFLDLFKIVRSVALAALFFVIISTIYTLLPSRKTSLKEALPGIVFAIVGTVAVNYIFSQFVLRMSDYSAVYGSLSAVVAFLIWINAIGTIIMAGAEINGILFQRSSQADG